MLQLLSKPACTLREGLALGWTFLMSSPGTAAQKSCDVEGNKKKLSKARPAPNKSRAELPLLGQDNVLPA
jgi:hypothetical protein